VLLEWVQLYGSPNTSKSSSAENGLALDGHERDGRFKHNMEQAMSSAQFGGIVSMTTFPKLLDEVDMTEYGCPGKANIMSRKRLITFYIYYIGRLKVKCVFQ